MYVRILPRDLFNESKLLKCYAQLALHIHDGKADPALRLEHRDRRNRGFIIDMDGPRNLLYCRNLSLRVRKAEIRVGTPINSREPYPMEFVEPDENFGPVFIDNGDLSPEFLQYVQRLEGDRNRA